MFTADDTRDLLRLFPPQKSDEFLPKLILSSGGHGFVTLVYAQAQFRSRVTKSTQRIPLSTIATELDVDPELIVQLVRTHPGLALLSADGSSVVTVDERDRLQQEFVQRLGTGLLDTIKFAAESDIDYKSVRFLVNTAKEQSFESDRHIWSATYEESVAQTISNLLKQALDQIRSVDVVPSQLPGSPPHWFVTRVLNQLLATQGFEDKIDLQEITDGVQCIPQKLLHDRKDAVVDDLSSGKQPFIDLQTFFTEFSRIFATEEDAKNFLRETPDIELFSVYALSKRWTMRVSHNAVRVLQETGRIDLKDHVPKNVPDVLSVYVLRQIAETIPKVASQSDIGRTFRVGDFVLTEKAYNQELTTIKAYAETEALSEWSSLKASPDKEIKFSLMNLSAQIPDDAPCSSILLNDKSVLKAIEDRFWTTILSEEGHNEAKFAEFWTERGTTRFRVHNESLSSLEDQKLRDQLAELLAIYAQKELLPDNIAKARSQGLVLSRKTQKNIARFESILKTDKTDAPSVLSALDKLNKKQGIATPDNSVLEEAKQALIADLVRRMQRQKSSDGPVLFLTLVLILFAKHFNNVVYATGKFAPKLLKQLKAVLPAEQYEQVEKWKEAAKTSSLSSEDRAQMKAMAEA
ncbi:hypothetical protein ACN47E_000493 [Coniothyrium glycines]